MIDRNVRKRALTSTNPSGSAVGVFPLSVSRVKSTEHSSAREGRSMSGRSRVPTVTLKAQKQDPKPSFDLNAKDVAIPTRSPSPPTRILKKRGGQFAYTPEDKEYFIKVIKYMHAYHPTLTPSEVLDYLAKKVGFLV